MNLKIKNLTTTRRKQIGVPVTNQEKYENMKNKNAKIENLKEVFDLQIDL